MRKIMMDIGRRTCGRFGIRQRVASVAAIAFLAVSPAMASVASSHLDGTGLAVAEAVFCEPVSAQAGDPGRVNPCIEAAKRKRDACYEASPWYLDAVCWMDWLKDVVLCVT